MKTDLCQLLQQSSFFMMLLEDSVTTAETLALVWALGGHSVKSNKYQHLEHISLAPKPPVASRLPCLRPGRQQCGHDQSSARPVSSEN